LPFIDWTTQVFDALYQRIADTYPSTEDAAKTFGPVTAFGSAMSAVFGGLQSALTMAGSMPSTWVVDYGTWMPFINWTFDVFAALYTLISLYYPSTAAEAEDFAPVSAWGNAVAAVFGGLQAALSIATNFTFTEPDGNTWARFEAFAQGVFYRLNQWVTTQYPMTAEEAQTGFAPVSAFGNALSAVFGGLQSALSIATNFTFTEPDGRSFRVCSRG
jgi:hypothetical protein